jgi:hypothetical protein
MCYDQGLPILRSNASTLTNATQLGRDEPSYSMDRRASSSIRGTRKCSANVAAVSTDADESADGAPLSLSPKEIGTSELFSRVPIHTRNGRFVAIRGGRTRAE